MRDLLYLEGESPGIAVVPGQRGQICFVLVVRQKTAASASRHRNEGARQERRNVIGPGDLIVGVETAIGVKLAATDQHGQDLAILRDGQGWNRSPSQRKRFGLLPAAVLLRFAGFEIQHRTRRGLAIGDIHDVEYLRVCGPDLWPGFGRCGSLEDAAHLLLPGSRLERWFGCRT